MLGHFCAVKRPGHEPLLRSMSHDNYNLHLKHISIRATLHLLPTSWSMQCGVSCFLTSFVLYEDEGRKRQEITPLVVRLGCHKCFFFPHLLFSILHPLAMIAHSSSRVNGMIENQHLLTSQVVLLLCCPYPNAPERHSFPFHIPRTNMRSE